MWAQYTQLWKLEQGHVEVAPFIVFSDMYSQLLWWGTTVLVWIWWECSGFLSRSVFDLTCTRFCLPVPYLPVAPPGSAPQVINLLTFPHSHLLNLALAEFLCLPTNILIIHNIFFSFLSFLNPTLRLLTPGKETAKKTVLSYTLISSRSSWLLRFPHLRVGTSAIGWDNQLRWVALRALYAMGP